MSISIADTQSSVFETSKKVAKVKNPWNFFGFRTRAAFDRKLRNVGKELQGLNARLSHVTDIVQRAATRQTFDALLFNTELQVDIEHRIMNAISDQHDELMQMVRRLEEKIDAMEIPVRQDISGPPPPYDGVGISTPGEKGSRGASGTQAASLWTGPFVNVVGIGAVVLGARWLMGV